MTTRLTWDQGSAYDLFISLHVLHHPGRFGLRPSWAAGVRSRLPGQQRAFLDEAQSFMPVPLHWLFHLPARPKDSAAALAALEKIDPAERLAALTLAVFEAPELEPRLPEVAKRGAWTDADREIAARAIPHLNGPAITRLLDAWSDPAAFGERYLQALQTYCEVFFAEEEARIQPALEEGLARAQALARDLPLPELLEELSHGVQFDWLPGTEELALVPSYWAAPLVFYHNLGPGRRLLLFGSRPEEQTLVPGEQVPAELVTALKALADPTRLRILRYLGEEPLTPSQLARRLRLRAPTVVHHLNTLRLAGLVQIRLTAEGEKRYALRSGAVNAAARRLQDFLRTDGTQH